MSTSSPVSANAQDFSESGDDDFVDNFAEGITDDGVPAGLGGERGPISEPASATLESDIVNGPSDGQSTSEAESTSTEPEATETVDESTTDDLAVNEEAAIPEVLLRMAGFDSAEAAAEAGLSSVESVHAFVRGRGQLLSGTDAIDQSDSVLYGRQPETQPATPEPATPPAETESVVTPYEIPAERLEALDPDLQDMIRGMNSHYQGQIEGLHKQMAQRTEQTVAATQQQEAIAFDQSIQGLGEQWHEVFGEGDGHQLRAAGQRSPLAAAQFQQREQLFGDAQAIQQSSLDRGLGEMTTEQAMQYALMQRYPDKFQSAVSNTPRTTRSNATASRPTQRRTPPKSQNDMTMDAVNKMLAKKGRPTIQASGDDEFADGI